MAKKAMSFRMQIENELIRQNRSRYWLSREIKHRQGAPSKTTLYRFLSGESDITSEPLLVIFEALGIK
tara:strand:+ start:252 stop:455 length:204 start_codon:yes stop_codon:yes gene_type:complete